MCSANMGEGGESSARAGDGRASVLGRWFQVRGCWERGMLLGMGWWKPPEIAGVMRDVRQTPSMGATEGGCPSQHDVPARGGISAMPCPGGGHHEQDGTPLPQLLVASWTMVVASPQG